MREQGEEEESEEEEKEKREETSYSQRSPGGNQVDGLPPERHCLR